MGFGAMGMMPLLFGAVAVTAIWGGLWLLLSAMGHRSAQVQPKELRPAQPPDQPAATTWQQPAFEHPRPSSRPTGPVRP
ncbi:MAG: hypothetical protein IT193_09425 [Propionibacteriaceae bacterium]|nr:hypothetical protein [Propionibacteriaceae bacterium]